MPAQAGIHTVLIESVDKIAIEDFSMSMSMANC
jgi:hypothetical protein